MDPLAGLMKVLGTLHSLRIDLAYSDAFEIRVGKIRIGGENGVRSTVERVKENPIEWDNTGVDAGPLKLPFTFPAKFRPEVNRESPYAAGL